MSRRSLVLLALLAGCDGVGRTTLPYQADTLMGVHFAGDPGDPDLSRMMDGRRGFTVELAYGEDPTWMPGTADHLRRLRDAGLTVILRLDYARGQNVPPPGAEEEFVAFVRDVALAQVGDAATIIVIGNEPNLDIECQRSGGRCEPEHYAQVYRRVREAARAAYPDRNYQFLVAGVSPGGVWGPRYLDGEEYYRRALGALAPGEVDGIAIHAYGGGDEEASVAGFVAAVDSQLATLRDAGYGEEPVFITEMNRETTGGAADEAVTARFLRRAYAWLDEHNRGGEQDIVGACWFVYAASDGWATYSLRGLKSGADDDASLDDQDVWHAFRAAARAGYSPGDASGAACSPPHTIDVGGRCVPSCGAAGGDTCDFGDGACAGYAAIESYDCPVCCHRGDVSPPPPPPPPPAGECACRDGVDNFCLYGASVDGCAMTWPGGYCDPNGDGGFDDADWVRGWTEYHDQCAPSCPCRDDVDNFCLYGASVDGCPMTWPGGYCDPNGDGSFDDADWVRGWTEKHDQCG